MSSLSRKVRGDGEGGIGVSDRKEEKTRVIGKKRMEGKEGKPESASGICRDTV